MNRESFLAQWKTHLTFAGLFVLVLGFNIVLGLGHGKGLLDAAWWSISEIRPMDYLMFVLFWYACAVPAFRDGWHTSLITLNLSQSHTKK